VVDKPLAITSDDAEGICARAAADGVALSVFHNRRWDSDTLAAQALLAAGTLGTLVLLESRFTRFRPEVPARWREDAAAGGGVLLDLGTHVVDQAVHLLGPATEVYAEVGVRRPGARVDDDCFLALTHASGARSHLWASMVAAVPGPRLLLQGTAAGWSKADLDGQEDALQLGWTPADGPVSEPPGMLVNAGGNRELASPPGDWAAYYRSFAAAVLDGAPLPVPASDGVAVLRVLEAARLSSERRAVSPAG
jgi:predicted dehydrogenase